MSRPIPESAVTVCAVREMAPGELYIDPKTGMFFSDAKTGLAEIIASVKSLVAS